MINKHTELVLDKICRSCMCQNENMRNVFESKEQSGQTLQLAEMLMECATIAINQEDDLPHLLCINCENKLSIAYEFKQQCQKSDTNLRQLLIANQPNIKEQSLDIVVQPDFNITNFYRESSESEDDDKNEPTKSFTCTFCQKVLRTQKGLRIHQRRHTGEKLRTCHMCNAQFTRTHHLIRHMKTHFKVDEGHICAYCGRQFVALNQLLTHQKMHETAEDIPENKTETEEIVAGEAGEQSTAAQNSDDNANDDDDEDYQEEEENEEYFKEEQIKEKKDKGSFQCEYCLKIMTTCVGLKIHMRRHTGSDLAKCDFCEKSFTKASHLKRHLHTHGIKEVIDTKALERKVMECEFCDRKFKYKKSFSHHMQVEHGVSDDNEALIAFLKTSPNHQSEQPTAVVLTTQIGPETHPQTVKEETKENEQVLQEEENDDIKPNTKTIHKCHVCEAKFSRVNHLTRHMIIHRAVLVHKCDRCDKTFASTDHLNKHVEEDHINKPYVCTICNRPFGRGEHLIRHLKIHQACKNKEDVLKCCICDKEFMRPDHLARHIKTHLLQDKRHKCMECGKAFNRLDNLKTHQRVHSGVKDAAKLHLCVYCGKEFNNSSNMIVHMRRHTGERPYKCSECGKGFPRSHDLKCHERTHSGEKPYRCSLCGKSFNKSNKLLRHNRVHTGERPYVCNICNRAFTQSNDLALHMRRHTGARPYACGVCPARFIQSGQLKAHRRSTNHWMETQPELKGGHRVEPVQSAGPPSPIRFKTHGKSKVQEDKKPLIDILLTDGILMDTKSGLEEEEKVNVEMNSTTTVTFQEQNTSVTYSFVAPTSSGANFSAGAFVTYPNYQ